MNLPTGFGKSLIYQALQLVFPSWAKELLQQQKEYGKELKRIKSELDSAKGSKHEKPGDKEPELKFKGNKKQYTLNKEVLGKISTAMNTSDDGERKNLLLECETFGTYQTYLSRT